MAKWTIPYTCFWALLINIDNFTFDYKGRKLVKSTILDGRLAGQTDGRTEKLVIEPARAQLEQGLGLSLAILQITI